LAMHKRILQEKTERAENSLDIPQGLKLLARD
jgi:hypothetical protein